MPGFDGTGPMGRGPFSGRGMGFCVMKLPEAPEEEAPAGLVGAHLKRMEGVPMPLGNGTGPAGLGPLTGRGVGFCAGYPIPGYMNRFGVGPATPVPGAYPAPTTVPGFAVTAGNPWPYPVYGGAFGAVWGRPFGGGFGRGFGRGGSFGLGFGRGLGRGRRW